ncbi:malectin domain-containing carbohydrate-binding protein [Pedobacter sp. MC2016-05]|uniref:malectin domain-containing carbohydrate-binding protein n=1 Tax=Pedobacter sp. MC2016-05 TaxID=2994474 RepID=UPI0022477281|nr:malectin domain-containing carbohydrate-binding protein [Pedobacter sp. MC2016-05]MCX2476664.1 malectin domain-containing carbohydrate-binding protein [Pedobacter sp. MC2016-05]
MKNLKVSFLAIFLCLASGAFSQNNRKDILLNANWVSIADEKNINAYNGFENTTFKTNNWKTLNVPHNWDQYEGYQRKLHGNKHGYAWYRKTFKSNEIKAGKRFFLYFEGVGSYATIWLNGNKVGYHAGGRTTFTLDVTDIIKSNNQENLLAVRADHPANIQDLPWVDGGCSTERGFSEGSQPMGIFRPVHLIVTNELRIEPFGVHIWNDNRISEKSALLNFATTVKNYGSKPKSVTIYNQLLDAEGTIEKALPKKIVIPAGKEIVINQETDEIINPKLWSLENPYLYTLKTSIIENGKVIDEIKTPYGIRWISWPIGEQANQKVFLLNGKPVFINGIAEYEHLIGNSHAFSNEQIRSRVMQIKSAGFNAFRDAHQPHNLLYQSYWDELGILSWTQMAAHIWYDTPEFRKNFKSLLVDWVKERRNSPSVVLWGLENESTLPEDFAKECTELIRKLDPTASSQRKVTTCNGGKGTDWDVPQNWTGTYGGNPATYGEDLKRQVLVGEYGAWRTIDLHEVDANGKGFTENKMTDLMETKVRLAETVKDQTAGHFFWLYSSHDNPGRVQGGEGLRDLDRIGPVNYKGMFTPWEEPTDVFYMFRANYAPKATEPMVYIVSHTWPNRWSIPGIKDSIVVYSNCDEVELFNDVDGASLGKQKRGAIGTHFQWNKPNIKYNVLYAVGYINGKAVAKDQMVLNSLPKSPNFDRLVINTDVLKPQDKYNYLYRLNCGGPSYQDHFGNQWLADQQLSSNTKNYGSTSWTSSFPGVPSFFASQRRTFSPIAGSSDWKLFQSFRYGRDQLKFSFPVPKDGEYLVELYFIEPWLGIGGGMNAEKMRLFDVAVNDKTVLKDVNIWKEAGANAVLKKTVKVFSKAGQLTISFPQIKVGQGLISAIAVASLDKTQIPANQSNSIVSIPSGKNFKLGSWMDIGDKQFNDSSVEFTSLPPNLYGAEWIQTSKVNKDFVFKLNAVADVFVALNDSDAKPVDYENTKTQITNSDEEKFMVFRKRFSANDQVTVRGNVRAIAIVPPSELEPAYDLKTVTSYKATDAKLAGQSIVKQNLMDKQRVIFKESSGGILEWSIGVGVADTYSLTIKYHNPFSKVSRAKIEFLSADGTLMKTEQAEFAPTKSGKWNYLNTNTGSMINAGSYKVRLIAIDAKELAIDALDVQ